MFIFKIKKIYAISLEMAFLVACETKEKKEFIVEAVEKCKWREISQSERGKEWQVHNSLVVKIINENAKTRECTFSCLEIPWQCNKMWSSDVAIEATIQGKKVNENEMMPSDELNEPEKDSRAKKIENKHVETKDSRWLRFFLLLKRKWTRVHQQEQT